MKTLYLIRHGQTEWNVQRRMQGRLDSPLMAQGVRQAHAHGRLLKQRSSIEALYVSPSGRTRETAYIVNSYVRARVEYTDALLERDVGEWSGLTMNEIESAYPMAHRARLEDPYGFRPPGGENLTDMGARVEEFLDGVLGDEHHEVGLVTHQIMSRVILGRMLELPPEDTVRVVHPNDIVYRLRISGTGIDVAHFLNGDGPRLGLLQHSGSETISRVDTRDTDVRT